MLYQLVQDTAHNLFDRIYIFLLELPFAGALLDPHSSPIATRMVRRGNEGKLEKNVSLFRDGPRKKTWHCVELTSPPSPRLISGKKLLGW